MATRIKAPSAPRRTRMGPVGEDPTSLKHHRTSTRFQLRSEDRTMVLERKGMGSTVMLEKTKMKLKTANTTWTLTIRSVQASNDALGCTYGSMSIDK